VAFWLAACAIGSDPQGSSGVLSIGPGGLEGTSGESGDSSSATTAGDEGSSGSLPVGCGNAVVEVGEECDDGDDDPCNGCDACMRRTFVVFDGGRGHLLEIADVAGAPLRLLDTPLTVEAWARIDDAAEELQISRRGAGNVGWRLGLQADGVIGTAFDGFDHLVEGVAPPGSGWHHIAWTFELGSSRLYLDGASIGELATDAVVRETNAPLRIGAKISGTGDLFGYAAGRVDEVRVSSVVRYDGPFTPVRRHEPDAATVLLLHLDEGEGVGVVDASANGHVGTAVGVGWGLDDGYGGCG
jgi:Concanavalin A-like lectin/glucanases superfamily